MKTRLFSTFFVVMMLSVSALAQNVSWVVKPGTYDRIIPCGTYLYEVFKDGRMGIINDTGREIVPVECKEITGFYEGYALALADEGGKRRIMGILSAEGDYAKVSDGRYYTIQGQEFFSEGLLTVTDRNGSMGYMNVRGEVVHTFNNDSRITPFSEGYAAVWIDGDYYLLDKRFNPIDIVLNTNNELEGGTNVYKGEAVLWAGGKAYKYNVSTGDLKKYKCKDGPLDYLWCYQELTGRSAEPPLDVISFPSSLTKRVEKNGRYGYERNGETMLSCQLEEAGEVYGDVAVVRFKGKVGMLKINSSSEKFSVVTYTPKFEYYKGEIKELVHTFRLSLPLEWSNSPLAVSVTNADGARFSIESKDGIYTFKTIELSGVKTYNVEIESEGMNLWTGQFTCNYIAKTRPKPVVDDNSKSERKENPLPSPQSPLTVSVNVKNTMADKYGRCSVVATIYNPNAKAVTTSVSFSGSELLNRGTHSVTIPAKGSRTVETSFTVKKVAKGQSVTVTCSAGGRASLTNLTLRPQK